MTLVNPSQVQLPAQQPAFSTAGGSTSVALTTSQVTILPDRSAVNARNRKNLNLYNAGPGDVLFSLGTSVSLTLFSGELLPTGNYDNQTWQGPVVARTESGTASFMATEEITII
ncbi:MAG: hypothetical protein JGK17_32430 [Microcoleus sp. PH2017_10_PVI_O_A]|uniref:hypothetical protein n=1 Tax=unclassified Microcoleus TaxID=2642155 RepID=UPI001DCB0B41|nr:MULTISPECIES: hypothetical protein [unclassified Microcoleus]MCC3410156.1 hypothetical protein [Microcoleus sp. PH2017_10_PVI_O_A]MCC3476495.1 hypothetical protein [Microcoleus sp. PH2017_12_PCY_D_A]MCC3563727.1 hypothetical protein [Microcoleus sp. PH2017_27_LUM_O_A]